MNWQQQPASFPQQDPRRPPTRDEQDIRRLVANWISATKSGDLDTVLRLMSEDVVFLTPGQPPMIGKAAYANAASKQSAAGAPAFNIQSEIQELKVIGDWAYLWSRVTVAVTPTGGGKAKLRAGHTLSIFRRERHRWVLARDANLLTAVPD